MAEGTSPVPTAAAAQARFGASAIKADTQLDHDGIARLIPHHGRMCLLDRLLQWDAQHIVCLATNHRDPQHPLRSASGLLTSSLVEYAAQAMALHGALIGRAAAEARTEITEAKPATIRAGYLASVRAVQLDRLTLDDLPHASPDELRVEVTRLAGDAQQILYDFSVTHAGAPLASGRAAVVLNTPLESP